MMTLGIFPWFCIAIVSITLPPLFWDLMSKLFRARLDRQRGIKLHWVAAENWIEDKDAKNSLEFVLRMSRGEWVVRLVHTFLFPHEHVTAGPVVPHHVSDDAEQVMTGVNVDVESGRSFPAKYVLSCLPRTLTVLLFLAQTNFGLRILVESNTWVSSSGGSCSRTQCSDSAGHRCSSTWRVVSLCRVTWSHTVAHLIVKLN